MFSDIRVTIYLRPGRSDAVRGPAWLSDPDPVWAENNCGADNHYVSIGRETYFISADGYLMPTKKNQPAPRLGNFDQPAR
jgi:hypothetical protein